MRFATWNTSALFHLSASKRRIKRGFLENLAKQADVLFLQETHGDVHHMATLLPRLASNFFIHSSPCDNLAAGGVITMIAKKWAGDQCEIDSEAL